MLKPAAILLIAASFQAYAQVQLTDMGDEQYEATLSGGTKIKLNAGKELTYFGPRPAPDKDGVHKTLNKMSQMNRDYGPALAVPESLNVRIYSEVGGEDASAKGKLLKSITGSSGSASAAEFQFERNYIAVGTKFDGSEEKSMPNTVHEYGHAMFSSALEKTVPQYAAYAADARETARVLDAFGRKYFAHDIVCSEAGKIINPEKTRKDWAAITGSTADPIPRLEKECVEYSGLLVKLKKIKERGPTTLSNSFELAKYSELFADTVTVVDSDDLDIGAHLSRGDKSRSFSACVAPKTVEGDAHSYLTQTRCEIGRLYRSAKAAGMPKAEFLKGVFKVLSSSIAQSLKQYSDEFYLTPLGVNEDQILIRQLRHEFEPAPGSVDPTQMR